MAICLYCGKSAGPFHKYHPACLQEAEARQNLGIRNFKAQIATALENMEPYPDLFGKLNQVATQYKLTSEVVGQAVLSSMEELSRHEPLEPQKAECLLKLGKEYVGTLDSIEPNSPFYHLCGPSFLNPELSRHLWLIMHHRTVPFSNLFDVVLQHGESGLAQFGTVLYRRTVMVSSHAGVYSGPSIRVASGLYYRFGAYGGRSMPTPSKDVSSGFLVLTNAAFYFGSEQRTFRVPYSSILRFKAYPDGLGFFRNVGDGREELFTVVDPWQTLRVRPLSQLPGPFHIEDAVTMPVGWFLYNLVMFLTAPEAAAPEPGVEQAPANVESADALGLEGVALRNAWVQPVASLVPLARKAVSETRGEQASSQLRANQRSLSDEEYAREEIDTEFSLVVIHMFGCNDVLTDRESQFYRAFRERLNPGVLTKLTDSQVRTLIETLLKPGTTFARPYSKPLVLIELEMYDKKNQSRFAEQARDFLTRLATAAALAGGTPSSKTTSELEAVKAALQSRLAE